MPKAYVPVREPRSCALNKCYNLFVSANANQRFCSKRCADYRPFNRRPNRECVVCGESFQPKDNTQRACGRACGLFLSASSRGFADRCDVQWYRCSECGHLVWAHLHKTCPTPRPMQGPTLDAPPIKLCPECGEWFAPPQLRESRRYCSWSCGHRVQNRNRRNAERAATQHGDKIGLGELALRDGWCCQICGGDVSQSIDLQHTRTGYTQDHIIPVTRGGMHTWSNVRLAHRSCNSSRGNEVDPILLAWVA